jgi:serine O-acetyltransferase
MNKTIRADLFRHDGLAGARGFLKGWFRSGFRYTFVFRKAVQYKNSSPLRFLFFRVLRRRYRFKYGYEISLGAQIGDGFYLSDHCGPVIIGPVKIGKNCNVSHSVTIGRSYRGGQIGRPTIGDRVWIGVGSVVVGKIEIGTNVMIAPNSFVNFDVPDNSLVIGNPAKIIKKDDPTRHYINNVVEMHDPGITGSE